MRVFAPELSQCPAQSHAREVPPSEVEEEKSEEDRVDGAFEKNGMQKKKRDGRSNTRLYVLTG